MAYDAKKRIHTCATLRKLWDTCQWNHEFNVSDKKNSFTELNTTIPKGSGFYSNCAHEDLAHVYDILHIHKTFLVCPVPYNYVDHDLGTTVEIHLGFYGVQLSPNSLTHKLRVSMCVST